MHEHLYLNPHLPGPKTITWPSSSPAVEAEKKKYLSPKLISKGDGNLIN